MTKDIYVINVDEDVKSGNHLEIDYRDNFRLIYFDIVGVERTPA